MWREWIMKPFLNDDVQRLPKSHTFFAQLWVCQLPVTRRSRIVCSTSSGSKMEPFHERKGSAGE